MSIFETLFKLVLVLGFAYLGYKLLSILYYAGQSLFGGIGWVFQGNKLDTLRRLLYLIIIAGYVATIYYFGFMWWMIPVALVSLITCYLAKDDPVRRLFAKDILVATGKSIAWLCGFVLLSAVLYYFFSDVSILEVGISGIFLGLWEVIKDIGKFFLIIFAILIFFSGGGRSNRRQSQFSGNDYISETESPEFKDWERHKVDSDRLESKRGKP